MWEETSKEDLKATVPTVSRLSAEPDLRVMVTAPSLPEQLRVRGVPTVTPW